jgi:hypothetical protein
MVMGQETVQRFTVLRLCLGRGKMKRAVFVPVEMRICPLHNMLIGLMILLIKPSG